VLVFRFGARLQTHYRRPRGTADKADRANS
jgi:hypothetical protein